MQLSETEVCGILQKIIENNNKMRGRYFPKANSNNDSNNKKTK